MSHIDVVMWCTEARFEVEIVDRQPMCFFSHNAFGDIRVGKLAGMIAEECINFWFGVECQVDLMSIQGRCFQGETFPIWGPDEYTAFYEVGLRFGEVASLAEPLIIDWKEMETATLDFDNVYFSHNLGVDESCSRAISQGKCILLRPKPFPWACMFTTQFTVDWRGMTAMSVLMIIPAIVFVILTQRKLTEGLTFGALKG